MPQKKININYYITIKNNFTNKVNVHVIKYPKHPTKKDFENLQKNYFCYQIIKLKQVIE